ncbi:MAG TPA: peptidoglycan DD-metalloendopeptidase family protein [Bacteroidales bacterium]|nr:peptidoglycan DD-metalloendopeptidase family protein [Bacteroidales bacterium]
MRFGFAIFLFSLSFTLFAQQGKDKIKSSQEKTQREIEYANKLLEETRGKAKASINEINIINHRLNKRKELLTGLEVEVSTLSQSIEKNQLEVAKVEKEIDKVKQAYALMITNLYKNRITEYAAMYILASENLNQLYKRIHTVKLYNTFLKTEKYRLDTLKQSLVKKNTELASMRQEKDNIVNKTKKETVTIQQEANEKQKLVQQLSRKQKEIEEDIREKQKTAKRLEAELRRMIEEERAKSKAKPTKEMVTPEEKLMSTDFEKNTGKLPWPTQKGIVSGKYGEHQHPDYKNVTIRNDGIYISTTSGENARAIFKGMVARVFQLAGQNYTVMIKHGRYFTLYHNLINVKVKPGQNVDTKQIIGTVATDSASGESILYFQVWKDTERSDPEIWLTPL